MMGDGFFVDATEKGGVRGGVVEERGGTAACKGRTTRGA